MYPNLCVVKEVTVYLIHLESQLKGNLENNFFSLLVFVVKKE